MAVPGPPLAFGPGLDYHRRALTLAMVGLAPPQATAYGYDLVSRVLVIHGLQQGGFLGPGDPWYLQTQLGRCQQQGRDRFYATVLLPLVHQGLGCPPSQRPPAFTATFGGVPYLGSDLFRPHPWEASLQVHIPDAPWEAFLAWLGEYPWQPHDPAGPDRLTLEGLGPALDHWVQGPESLSWGAAIATAETALMAALRPLLPTPWQTLAELAALLDGALAETLVTKVFPALPILVLGCGGGQLLGALLTSLWPLYWGCWHQAQTSGRSPLQAWASGIRCQGPQATWALTAALISRHLYGLDDRPGAIAATQAYLALTLLSTTTPAQGLAPLPPLFLNCFQGNPLVGVIRVEESNFYQTIPEEGLQGSLLPVLAADRYQTLLQEWRINLEVYRHQVEGLQGDQGWEIADPTALLHQRMDPLRRVAQAKLNQLLLLEMSQTLGLRWRHPTTDKPQILDSEAIAHLDPCHLGFHCHSILANQGGFALVLGQPPAPSLRPLAETFYQEQEPLFQALGLGRTPWLRHRSQCLADYPALQAPWADYVTRLRLLTDYCRRSPAYGPWPPGQRTLPWATLLHRRGQQFCRPQGHVQVVVPPEAPMAPKPGLSATAQ